MPFAAPLLATDWNVTPELPTSVLVRLTAVPVVLATALPVPVRLMTPLVAALRPTPLVVFRVRPPPVRFSVWPSLDVIEIAFEAPVSNASFALLRVVEPPLLLVSE